MYIDREIQTFHICCITDILCVVPSINFRFSMNTLYFFLFPLLTFLYKCFSSFSLALNGTGWLEGAGVGYFLPPPMLIDLDI